jgi:hypothetical protein
MKKKPYGYYGPLKTYRRHKYINCWKQGIPFDLTVEELQQLLDDAGITIEQVGRGSADYNLARYGDTGPYAMGNCRFITKRENIQERDSTCRIVSGPSSCIKCGHHCKSAHALWVHASRFCK